MRLSAVRRLHYARRQRNMLSDARAYAANSSRTLGTVQQSLLRDAEYITWIMLYVQQRLLLCTEQHVVRGGGHQL